jgi:ring-1,2-phenylacetyl-CoA epoxidase subunit PaaB
MELAVAAFAPKGADTSLWVVPLASITSTRPAQRGPFFEPAADKVFRQPTYYVLPHEVQHL